jgi:F-type H+-transporting ATPase subunit delta
MSNSAVARRYAQALVDLCDERGDHQAVRSAFDNVAAICRDVPEVVPFLANPTVAEADRTKLLDELISRTKADGAVANFVRLLLERGRFAAIVDIHERFSELLDGRTGRVVAHVTSAAPLVDAKIAEIKKMLAGAQGRDVTLDHDVDTELIGGLVIRVGNTIYDGSVRNHLERLRERMLAGSGA